MDLYALLGVRRDASADEIRRAYRQAVLAWHPDRNQDPDAPAVFHAVQHAYDHLRDPERRRSYDFALDGIGGVRKLRLGGGESRPDWLPPQDEREPLRFVVGEGWTALDDAPPEPAGAATDAAKPPARKRRRWTRDERLSLAVALVAAVGAGIAIAIAPLFS